MHPGLVSLFDVAARQHGVLSREQATLCGVRPQQLHRFIERGQLTTLTPSVLRAPGSPASPLQSAMTGVLEAGPGSTLSHTSALAIWQLTGFTLDPVHALQVRDSFRRSRPAVTVHSCRHIPPDHVTVLDGIPVTTPTRSLFDSAALIHPKKLERAVDAAWSRRLTSGVLLHRMLDELAAPGRCGIRAMRAILAERGPDYIPPASALERRFHEIIADDGQPPMRRQADLGDAVAWLARVDAFDDDARLVAEIDGDRFHRALTDSRADAARQRRLEAAGFRVIRFTEDQVWRDPRHVATTTRQARRAGRRRHGASLW